MGVDVVPEVGSRYGRYIATQTTFLAQRLLMLDELWTAELARAASVGEVDDEDVMVFERLVGEMQAGLEGIGDAAYKVRMMIDELGAEGFDLALDRITASQADLGGDLLGILAAEVPDFEPQSATIAACDYIREKASAEAALLDEKLAVIRNGELTPGDFLMPFKCAGLLLLVGAGVAATISTGGAAAPVLLGVASQVGFGIREWRRDSCRVELPVISFERRG